MNLPDKCPFCGARIAVMEFGGEGWMSDFVAFECRTYFHGGANPGHTQMDLCKGRELHQLRARVTELEARCKRLEGALVSIAEYWNRDNNERAMEDACWHAVETAVEALTHEEAKP